MVHTVKDMTQTALDMMAASFMDIVVACRTLDEAALAQEMFCDLVPTDEIRTTTDEHRVLFNDSRIRFLPEKACRGVQSTRVVYFRP